MSKYSWTIRFLRITGKCTAQNTHIYTWAQVTLVFYGTWSIRRPYLLLWLWPLVWRFARLEALCWSSLPDSHFDFRLLRNASSIISCASSVKDSRMDDWVITYSRMASDVFEPTSALLSPLRNRTWIELRTRHTIVQTDNKLHPSKPDE